MKNLTTVFLLIISFFVLSLVFGAKKADAFLVGDCTQCARQVDTITCTPPKISGYSCTCDPTQPAPNCNCTLSCNNPPCVPGATTCGSCSVSCGGGTQTCTDGCSSWSNTCNTQSCCTPNCSGKQCGSDGCGGSCGTCSGGICQGGSTCCYYSSPSTPTLSSPSNGASLSKVSSVDLSWNAIGSWGQECSSGGSETYTVCVGTDSSNPCSGYSTQVSSSTTTATYTQNLPGTYYWRVTATNAAGYSSTSSTWDFVINNHRPVVGTGSPAEISSNGTFDITSTVSDQDGGSDVQRVYFGFTNCTVDPGDANWSRFEHELANTFGAFTWVGSSALTIANDNTEYGCTGSTSTPVNPWTTTAPFQNYSGDVVLNSVSNTTSGNTLTSTWNLTLTNFPVTDTLHNYNYYMMAQDKENLWATDPTSWTKLNSVCVEGGPYLTYTPPGPTCGTQTISCTEDCSTVNDCAGQPTSQCTECFNAATNVSAWTAWSYFGYQRSRYRTCDEYCSSDGYQCEAYFSDPANCPGGGNDCTYSQGGPLSFTQFQQQDMTGQASGTLYDASDVSSCAQLTSPINGQNTAITYSYSSYPPLTSPINVGTNGTYSFTAYAPGTYTPDFTNLYNAGLIGSATPKLSCNGLSVTFGNSPDTCVTQPCETITGQDYGFWKTYGGWWQAVGGPLYAGSSTGDTIKSSIPSSMPAPASNQYLIKPGTTANNGFAFTGGNVNLGTNPSAQINGANTYYQGTFNGDVVYNYDFFSAKYSDQTSPTWNSNNLPSYVDGGNGYMYLKYSGSSPVSIGAKTITSGQKYIVLVPGSVNITGNLTVNSGGFLAIIASGNITFASNVSRADGWYMADGTLTVNSTGNTATEVQFVGNGSFVGYSGISLSRDRGNTNNTSPAQQFTYSYQILDSAPDAIKFPFKKYFPYTP